MAPQLANACKSIRQVLELTEGVTFRFRELPKKNKKVELAAEQRIAPSGGAIGSVRRNRSPYPGF